MDYTRWRGREKGVSVLAAILNAAGKRTPRFLRGPFRLLFSYGLNMFSDLYQRRKKKKKSPISFIPPSGIILLFLFLPDQKVSEKKKTLLLLFFSYITGSTTSSPTLSLSLSVTHFVSEQVFFCCCCCCRCLPSSSYLYCFGQVFTSPRWDTKECETITPGCCWFLRHPSDQINFHRPSFRYITSSSQIESNSRHTERKRET